MFKKILSYCAVILFTMIIGCQDLDVSSIIPSSNTSNTSNISVSYDQINITVELSPIVVSPLDRCIEFNICNCDTKECIVISEVLHFVNGISTTQINVPEGEWTCISAQDVLHTLKTTIMQGTNFYNENGTYTANFTNDNMLINGNLNRDNWIDITDYGIFVNRWGVIYDNNNDLIPDGNTDCDDTLFFMRHADINGNGTVDTSDYTFIQIYFFTQGDDSCVSD